MTATPAIEAIWSALHAHPGSTAEELAKHAGVGRSTVSKALQALAAHGVVNRTRQETAEPTKRRTADLWTAEQPTAADSPEPTRPSRDTEPGGATEPEDAAGSHRSAASSARTSPATPSPIPDSKPGKLGKGQLGDLVLAHLQAHPDQDWSPRALWKVLDRSSGAIGNALERFTDKGLAVRVSDRPRRYRIAPTSR